MKKFKRLASVMLVGTMLVSVGCAKSSNNEVQGLLYPKSEISVLVSEYSGINSEWINKKALDFEYLHSEDVIQEGHKGVRVRVEKTDEIMTNSFYNEYRNIFIFEGEDVSFLYEYSKNGFLEPLEDLVKAKTEVRYVGGEDVPYSIEDKIIPEYRSALKGFKNQYYAIPTSGTRSGIIYDANNFEEFGLYFANPSTANQNNSVTYTCKYGTGLFVKANSGYIKSCGNDGVFGTVDDGLPTSLEELFILCDYMYKGIGATIRPFVCGGDGNTMKQDLVQALWASLGGREEYQAQYTLSGKVNVVTGSTQEPAFKGIDYIKQPTFVTRDVYERNGYLANASLSRYWAISALSVIEKEGWFYVKDGPEQTRMQKASDFVLNGYDVETEILPRVGMIIENDGWYAQCKKTGVIDKYNKCLKDEELNLGWMSLPTKVTGTVEPNKNGVANTLFEAQKPGGIMVINANYTKESEIVKLCKDFLAFINTDDALSLYTEKTGTFRCGMDYKVKETTLKNLSSFEKSMVNSYYSVPVKSAPVITEKCNPILYEYYHKNIHVGCLADLIENGYYTVQELFDKSCVSEAKWNGIMSGAMTWYSPEPDTDEIVS